jgi:transcriptional regulator with XRE-family HTH domain
MQNDMMARKGPQLLDPKTLAWWVQSLRHASGWSQETLAELSGLTVRTVQRVEAGFPSSVDTRRALAIGFGYGDVDAFNKPEMAHKLAEIIQEIRQIEEQASDLIQLPATRATSGSELGRFAETISAHAASYDDELTRDASETAAAIVDYMRDYADVNDLYSERERLNAYDDLGDLLEELIRQGGAIYYAVRHVRLVGETWKDKTPLPLAVGYISAIKNDRDIKYIAAPKRVSIG